MRVLAGPGGYRVDHRASPVDLIVLEPDQSAAPGISLHGYRGNALPGRLTDPVIEMLSHAGRLYRLTAGGVRIEFQARSVLAHEPAGSVLAPVLQPFALRPRQRLAVTLVLRLLRFRFGGALLAAWHSSRR